MVTERVTVPKPPQRGQRMSLEEFRQLPESWPRWEFEAGEVKEVTAPTTRHQEVLTALLLVLRSHIRSQRLGRVWPEVNVELMLSTGPRVYIPDLVFLSQEHLHRHQEGRIIGPPDLVVEITSPSTASRDHLTKLAVYHQAGVPWYWIVDAEELGIEEYQATPEGYLRTASVEPGQVFAPKLFPNLQIDLQTLLQEEPEE